MSEQVHRGKRFLSLASLSIFLAAILSRVPFLSSYLYDWDAVQFALALHDFDIAKQQPQPPGYLAYVALARLLNAVVRDDNLTLCLLATLFTAFSGVLIFLLALRIFSERRTAILVSCLWLSSPLVWFFGEVADIYAASACASLLVAFCVYAFWKEPSRATALWAGIGFAAGSAIRPDLVVFLGPLWLFAAWNRRECRRFLPWAVGLFLVGYCVWYVPTLLSAGGFSAYSGLVQRQFVNAVRQSSILWGASPLAHAWMVVQVFSAFLVGLLAFWVLSLYVALRLRKRRCEVLISKEDLFFLAVWIAPSLLFYLLIHGWKMAYCLSSLPPAVLLAGRWLPIRSEVAETELRPRFATICLLTVMLNAGFFFLVPKLAGDFHYQSAGQREALVTTAVNHSALAVVYDEIRQADAIKSTYFAAIRQALSEKPAILVVFHSLGSQHLTSRMAMYYFPEIPVYGIRALDVPPGRTTPLSLQVGFWRDTSFIQTRYGVLRSVQSGSISLLGRGRALLLVASDASFLNSEKASDLGLRDVSPAGLSARSMPYRLLLFEAKRGPALKLASGTRSVTVGP